MSINTNIIIEYHFKNVKILPHFLIIKRTISSSCKGGSIKSLNQYLNDTTPNNILENKKENYHRLGEILIIFVYYSVY